jgi:hypothetical protein
MGVSHRLRFGMYAERAGGGKGLRNLFSRYSEARVRSIQARQRRQLIANRAVNWALEGVPRRLDSSD